MGLLGKTEKLEQQVHTKVGFIGCGMMGSALMTAVSKVVADGCLFGYDQNAATLAKVSADTGATSCTSAIDCAEKVDVLFLAVKPAYVPEVLKDITSIIPADQMPLLVSIAAGVKIDTLKKLALTNCRFIRLMPNLPATVGEAMIALTCQSEITPEDVQTVATLLAKAGVVEMVPENLMDCVTGVSGSGPAFVFMFIEAFADAAVKLGMPRKQAYTYAAQTVKGAAAMVLETGRHPAELKDAVCSPAGTTIAGVEALEENGFRQAVMQAAIKATERSIQLGKPQD